MLFESLKDELRDYSNENSPNECCGLIIEKNDKISFFKCANISSNKKTSCVLSPLDYMRAYKKGKIIAHFHSQPDKSASIIDYINAVNHNIFSVIYSWEFDLFSFVEPKLKDYLNKDYNIGKSDCYTLVIDYFRDELGVKLKDYERKGEWWKESPNLILDNFKKEGGIAVDFKDIKRNDVVAFNLGGAVCHFAIYLGDGMYLHHPYNEKSIISEIDEKYIKKISLVIRHKSLF